VRRLILNLVPPKAAPMIESRARAAIGVPDRLAVGPKTP